MKHRFVIILLCGLLAQGNNVSAGPTMSKISNNVLNTLDRLNDKEKMTIIASSMVVAAIGSFLYQSSIIQSAAANHNHSKLNEDLTASESLGSQEDDLAHLDFERYSQLGDELVPPLEYACDTMNLQDRILGAQVILDVNEWSQFPMVKHAPSVRTIPPVRGSDTYNFRITEKK